MNRYIIYIDITLLGFRRLFWIKWVSIIGGLYEDSRLMLEGAQCVWTQSGEWHCISITSMSSLHPWIELISIPAVILVWHSESKIHRYLVISAISHVYICCSYTWMEFKINIWKFCCPQGQIINVERLEKVMYCNGSVHYLCCRKDNAYVSLGMLFKSSVCRVKACLQVQVETSNTFYDASIYNAL